VVFTFTRGIHRACTDVFRVLFPSLRNTGGVPTTVKGGVCVNVLLRFVCRLYCCLPCSFSVSCVVLFLSCPVLCCCGVVLVVSCVVLFSLCECVRDVFLFWINTGGVSGAAPRARHQGSRLLPRDHGELYM